MKTQTLFRPFIGIKVIGLAAAAAFAGPPPQYGQRPAPQPAPKPAIAAPAKCDGCKTAPMWAAGDRSPAGKGPYLRVSGTKHGCSRCVGAIATEAGRVKNSMAHNAGCGPLLCCR
jgi:hypothetical protein